ncbi:hypothetical protein [Fischerella sp. PCC 9605]|uniref:hypothetical protein n=1 Tax=Fischerella sp. PCC 9605 TaxID=1173024 RepID=UPI0004797E4B|nr:hypothetical protein [Fischerella sp. PCC 9605]
MDEPQELLLTKLGEGLPAITPSFGAALAEACAVCLEDQNHSQGVELTISGDFTTKFKLYWQPVTEQMLRCWNDEEFTTEQAAYSIAFLIIRQLTDLTVIERSRKGTGFDYWLGSENENSELPFQNKVRLEVSGIRKGDDSRIRARVKQKIEQTNPSDGKFPAYIIVVEFSKPLSMIVKK